MSGTPVFADTTKMALDHYPLAHIHQKATALMVFAIPWATQRNLQQTGLCLIYIYNTPMGISPLLANPIFQALLQPEADALAKRSQMVDFVAHTGALV